MGRGGEGSGGPWTGLCGGGSPRHVAEPPDMRGRYSLGWEERTTARTAGARRAGGAGGRSLWLGGGWSGRGPVAGELPGSDGQAEQPGGTGGSAATTGAVADRWRGELPGSDGQAEQAGGAGNGAATTGAVANRWRGRRSGQAGCRGGRACGRRLGGWAARRLGNGDGAPATVQGWYGGRRPRPAERGLWRGRPRCGVPEQTPSSERPWRALPPAVRHQEPPDDQWTVAGGRWPC